MLRKAGLVLGVSTLSAFAITGCGGSSKHSSAPTTTLPAAVVSYTQCLKGHGVSSSTSAPTLAATSAILAAQTACGSGKPTGDAVNFRACLRVFGVTAQFNKTNSMQQDPHYAMASKACNPLKKKTTGS